MVALVQPNCSITVLQQLLDPSPLGNGAGLTFFFPGKLHVLFAITFPPPSFHDAFAADSWAYHSMCMILFLYPAF